MRVYVNGRVDNDGADGIGVVPFDLLGVGTESEKQKAESKENAFSHLIAFAENQAMVSVVPASKIINFPAAL